MRATRVACKPPPSVANAHEDKKAEAMLYRARLQGVQIVVNLRVHWNYGLQQAALDHMHKLTSNARAVAGRSKKRGQSRTKAPLPPLSLGKVVFNSCPDTEIKGKLNDPTQGENM